MTTYDYFVKKYPELGGREARIRYRILPKVVSHTEELLCRLEKDFTQRGYDRCMQGYYLEIALKGELRKLNEQYEQYCVDEWDIGK